MNGRFNGPARGALLVPPAAKGEMIRQKRCENCKFRAVAATPTPNTPASVCRRSSPVPLLIPIGLDDKGVPRFRLQAMWPPVGPNDWCHDWKPTIEGVSA